MRRFQHDQWPGNVRQLFNVLRTAAVMAAGEAVMTHKHLSDDLLEQARAAQPGGASTLPAAPPTSPAWSVEPTAPQRSLEETGVDAIRHAVAAAGGNISEASKRLGISRNTSYRQLRWNKQA